jgi:outer membrane biosynthesis protein TonB
LQGHVVVHLVISPAGDLLSADPVSGNPIFAQAAVAAMKMKKWKFQPYLHNGQPVPIAYKMPYDFAISDRVNDVPDAAATGVPTSEVEPSSHVTASATGGTNQGDDTQGQDSAQTAEASSYRTTGANHPGHFATHARSSSSAVYPNSARRSLIQGAMVSKAIIGQRGRIENLRPISGPQEPYVLAVGAVQQWRYKPFLLDGKPVESKLKLLSM